MYLESDELLSKFGMDLKDDTEVYALIHKVFPKVDVMPIKGSYYGFALQFICQLCHVVSMPELGRSLGSVFSAGSSRVKLSRQMERGAIKPLDFMCSDMGSDKGYFLSAIGASSLLSLLPFETLEKNKIRRNGGKVPVHDYGIGLSLLQCMLLGIPYKYQKEVCYSYGAYKAKGTLCCDAVIEYHGKIPFTIYLEQDMGTEVMQTLIHKIADYHRLSLAKCPDLLVISSHAVIDDSRYPAYSKGSLKALLAAMEQGGFQNLGDFYQKEGSSLPPNKLCTLKSLLVKVGCGYAVDHVTKKRLPADRVTASTLVKLYDDAAFSDKELSRYIKELDNHTNPYRIRDYNRQQVRDTKNKYRGICSKLHSLMMQGEYDHDGIRPFLSGFQTLVTASVFLSDTLAFYSPLNEHLADALYTYLREYYADLDKDSYVPVSEPVRIHGDYPAVTLHHCFSFGSDSLLCVEHIGKDIGGFVRSAYLLILNRLGLLEDKTVHVVCLCDMPSDITYYSSLLQYYKAVRKIPSSGFFLSFLLESDLAKGERLKMTESLDGERMELYTIPTPKQREEELQMYGKRESNSASASSGPTLADLLLGK